MLDHKENLTPKQNEIVNQRPDNTLVYVVTIFFGILIVAMAILGAGWLIAKEIAKQSAGIEPVQNVLNYPISIIIPEDLARQGNRDSKVTVIEFADFQCPFCGEWHKEIYPKLKSEYIDNGKVNFVFWDLAFLGEESLFAAEAALCAKDQGKFWEYHDKLFNNQNGENQNGFSNANLKKFGAEIGLVPTDFNSCVDSRIYKPIVEESTTNSNQYLVNSTPTVFINGLRFEGVMPWENYKQIIESELAK